MCILGSLDGDFWNPEAAVLTCTCILGEHAQCLLDKLLKWGTTGPEKQGQSQYRQRTAWLSEAETTSGRPIGELAGQKQESDQQRRKRKQIRGQRKGRAKH